MNYNPKMGFSEQDYHLLKTHQSSGSKPYEIVTVEKNTVAQLELVANVDNLNDIVVFLNIPALGSSAVSTELVLRFTGDNELDKQVYQIACSKTARTSHMVTFKNTDGFYELSYCSPANGEIGLDQKSWAAKTWNAAYNTNIGSFTQIPVNKITLSVDNLSADENLPVGTQMGVLAR
mgnify:FL=1|nr:MAG TPA: hypothetical protein [Bacteriophage sp.]